MKKVASWKYKTRNGDIIGVVNRFESKVDNKKSSKQIIPCFKRDGQGNFSNGFPDDIKDNRCLYGLDTIKDNKVIYIAEGEKCAYALNSAFGHACITSSGGAKCASKSNWSEISFADTYILLPDNDESGMQYMKDVYSILKKLNPSATFKLVELSELPSKGDFCDWVLSRINEEWDELKPLNKVLPKDKLDSLNLDFNKELENFNAIPSDWKFNEGYKGLRSINMNDMLKLNIPKNKVLLSPWLTEQSLTLLYANRGVGKTFFALNCAYALASGGKFLKYQSEEKVSTIYFDGEMQAHLMKDRLKNISYGNNEDIPLHIVTPDLQNNRGLPDLSSIEGQKEFDEMIDNLGAKVIFIDNLSTLVRSGKENDSESWNPIQNWAIKHRSKGRSIVFVHHGNKDGGQRGTSKKEDIQDNVIKLEHPEDYDSGKDGAKFEVSFKKNRSLFGKDTATILASLGKGNEWSWSYVTSEDDKILEMFESGMKQKEIAKEVNKSTSCICKMIKRAKEERKINQN